MCENACSRAAAAAPVVGWPPVRSFRRNLASSSSSSKPPRGGRDAAAAATGGKVARFVKVNMDGVPIGRKVDLAAHGGYGELSAAVDRLFRGLLAGKPHHLDIIYHRSFLSRAFS